MEQEIKTVTTMLLLVKAEWVCLMLGLGEGTINTGCC